jgi:two-component sensor histidine kinase
MDIAVPLGLIVNEIVSSSLKYAFPGGIKGSFELNFTGKMWGHVQKASSKAKKKITRTPISF